VVIVTFNSQGVIGPCLASIDPRSKIIVVDNASIDATVALCRRLSPGAEVIVNPGNYGFARACNLGLARVDTQYMMFLNPDARLNPDAVSALLRAVEQFCDAALLGPALENVHGKTVASHDVSRLRRHSGGAGEPEIPSGPCCVDFLLGAAILARTDVVRAVGGFDNSVFLFYEDDDLCERIRQAGHSIVYVPDAHVLHLWGHSSRGGDNLSEVKAWHMGWSRLYMLEKHVGRSKMQAEAIPRIAYCAMRTLVYLAVADQKRARVTMAQLRGLVAYLMGKDCFREVVVP
jgi:GT2 family glycosyltransferase